MMTTTVDMIADTNETFPETGTEAATLASYKWSKPYYSSNKRRNDLVRSLRNVGVYVAAFSILIMPYAMARLVERLCLLVDNDNMSCRLNSNALETALDWFPYIHTAVHPVLFMITQRAFSASCRQLLKKFRNFLHL